MGIKGVEYSLHEECSGGITTVYIRDLVANSNSRNVIVVDGNQFYERYLYDKCQWLLGGIQEFVEDICMFVRSFRKLGLDLVFFFTNSLVIDSMRPLYIARRNKNYEFFKDLLHAVSKKAPLPERGFNDKPLNVKCLAVYVLQEVMKCEIHWSVNTEEESVKYAVANNCLAILSQNSFYIFYEQIPAYLSLKHLNLTDMCTFQYHQDVFFKHISLASEFYPLFATIVGVNDKSNAEHPSEMARKEILKIITGDLGVNNIQCQNFWSKMGHIWVCQYILKYFEGNDEDKCKIIIEKFEAHGEILISYYNEYVRKFSLIETEKIPTANTYWEMILEHAHKLCVSGKMCMEIRDILIYSLYQHHTVMEDFKEFPASALAYRPLRQQLYGILLHEAPEEVRNNGIQEWCVYEEGCPEEPTIVSPALVDDLHPGLLTLWDDLNINEEVQNKRWQLFLKAVSLEINVSSVRQLPSNLVIPVTVLFYLIHVIPNILLKSWEVEVFIAVAMILPKKNVKFLSEIKVAPSVRAVRLSAYFMSGCHLMQILAQVCGLDIKNDCPIYRYFDGKLFHSFYDKASWRRSAASLGPEMKNETFLRIKDILHLN